ncbi:hypothetical protein SDC9_176330 [bioreactor metagenome]|uniref:Uncharacterized protein n=1 Tax=bioreactor metagenome TaxID=1076179 RepID=A0A645GQD2_9ZZZZ
MIQHLVWAFHAQALLPNGVGEPLVDSQLIAPVLQVKHAKAVVKSLESDSTLPFHFAIAERGCDAGTLIFDIDTRENLFKQGFMR